MSDDHRDDVVMWIVIGFCLVAPVVLTTFWAFGGHWYPPMLLSLLLGIAVAALTYRYLGGTTGSEFSVGVLKVAGSAALLLGTTYVANVGLSTQMDADNSPNKLVQAGLDLKAVTDERDKYAHDLQTEKEELQDVQRQSVDQTIAAVAKLAPGSDLGRELVEMAKSKRGPFSEIVTTMSIRVTIVGYVKDQGNFNVCPDLGIDADAQIRFTRDYQDKNGELVQPVLAKESGTIEAAVCSKSPRRFDVQISCLAGAILFPDQIGGCGRDGSVLWKVPNGDRVFPISLEVLNS